MPVAVAGIALNINDRKIAQEDLIKSQQNYKNFVEHSPDIIYKFSNKRGGLFWSDRVEAILGYSALEILNDPFLWTKSIHPDDQKLVRDAIEEDSKGAKYDIDYRIKTKDGKWVWLHDHFMHKTFIEDEVIIEGQASDVTKRKELEDSLRILSYAVDQSPVSIVITDTNGLIEYVNPKFTQLTGYSLIEAFEKKPHILKSGYTADEEYANLWKTIKSGNEWIGEFCNKKKNGELYWESAVISPIINEKDEITHFVAVKEDITSQKETERRIQASIIEAEERERIHFSQELHDGIGPLLSATKMYVQWLGMPNAQLEHSEIIRDIEKFLDESSRTIREISFKLSPHILQNFGLVEAIKSYTSKVKETTDININLKLEDISRFEMNNETIAYRVLCECINNTMKHAKATQVSIEIYSKNDLLFVEYSDNGIGFNTDNSLSGRKGIGLLNMQNRLKSINGQVGISSAPGKGTTVKFQFKMNKK
jgi:PAS domain S-box-containing protein